jgi:hypothetical protein
MRDPDTLIADEVFQQLPGRSKQPSGRGQGEEDSGSSDDEIQMQPALGAGGAAALRRQQEQLYRQYALDRASQGGYDDEDDEGQERDAEGAAVVRTEIAGLDIAVPVPGQRKRRYAWRFLRLNVLRLLKSVVLAPLYN